MPLDWLNLALSGLVGAVGALLIGTLIARQVLSKINALLANLAPPAEDLVPRVEAIEAQLEQITHEDLSARGKYGAEVKAELRAETEDAMQEGQQVILGPGTPEQKLGKFTTLIMQHPKVALTVAKRLNQRFGISKALGISEEELFQQVLAIVQRAEAAQVPENTLQIVMW